MKLEQHCEHLTHELMVRVGVMKLIVALILGGLLLLVVLSQAEAKTITITPNDDLSNLQSQLTPMVEDTTVIFHGVFRRVTIDTLRIDTRNHWLIFEGKVGTRAVFDGEHTTVHWLRTAADNVIVRNLTIKGYIGGGYQNRGGENVHVIGVTFMRLGSAWGCGNVRNSAGQKGRDHVCTGYHAISGKPWLGGSIIGNKFIDLVNLDGDDPLIHAVYCSPCIDLIQRHNVSQNVSGTVYKTRVGSRNVSILDNTAIRGRSGHEVFFYDGPLGSEKPGTNITLGGNNISGFKDIVLCRDPKKEKKNTHCRGVVRMLSDASKPAPVKPKPPKPPKPKPAKPTPSKQCKLSQKMPWTCIGTCVQHGANHPTTKACIASRHDGRRR